MHVLTTTVARSVFALVFAVFGIFHFMNGPAMAGMVPSYIPGGVFWVYLTGLALLAAAVSLIIQKYAYWGMLGLAAMLFIFVLTIHLPQLGSNQAAMPNLLKDLALAAAALTHAGLHSGQAARD